MKKSTINCGNPLQKKWNRVPQYLLSGPTTLGNNQDGDKILIKDFLNSNLLSVTIISETIGTDFKESQHPDQCLIDKTTCNLDGFTNKVSTNKWTTGNHTIIKPENQVIGNMFTKETEDTLDSEIILIIRALLNQYLILRKMFILNLHSNPIILGWRTWLILISKNKNFWKKWKNSPYLKSRIPLQLVRLKESTSTAFPTVILSIKKKDLMTPKDFLFTNLLPSYLNGILNSLPMDLQEASPTTDQLDRFNKISSKRPMMLLWVKDLKRN